MSDTNYRPNGDLQGDTRSIPSRGTGTGMGGADTMGMSIDQNATNRRVGISGSTKSDPWAERSNETGADA